MRHLTADQVHELAAQVRKARAGGAPWKTLAAVYNRSERQLRRYIVEPTTSVVETGTAVVGTEMSDNNT